MPRTYKIDSIHKSQDKTLIVGQRAQYSSQFSMFCSILFDKHWYKMSSCSYKHNPKSFFPNTQFLVLCDYYHCYFYLICLKSICKESVYSTCVTYNSKVSHCCYICNCWPTKNISYNSQKFVPTLSSTSLVPMVHCPSNWELSKKILTWSSCYVLQIAYCNTAVYFSKTNSDIF